jgi:large subunit ribosomal protein L13
MRTNSVKAADALASRKWWVVDASGVPLGRLASTVATVLRGKHKPSYTPHVDTGDFVVVINAEKVKVTGAKADSLKYYRHSGHPGSIKAVSFRQAVARKPEIPIEHAVKGMLPKNVLGRQMLSKLKVYAGAEHPHKAQKPEVLAPPTGA